MARVEQSIEVNVPVSVAYNQLTQFEEFPSFMEGVHTVRQLDDAHLHWHARRSGKEMEWDSEITRQIPDRCIAWRNTSGPKNEGEVTLYAVEPDRTLITLVMDADDEILKHHESDADLLPEQDLMRFKKMIEGRQQASGAWRGEIRNGQRVDGKEAEDSPVGGSVVGQTTDQILDALQESKSRVVKLQRGQLPSLQPPWQTQPWLPGFFRAWEAQFSLLHTMGEEMQRLFELWLTRAGSRAGTSAFVPSLMLSKTTEWAPPVEVSEQDNRIVISADLPGIHKEDVQVEIGNDILTIEGERREENQQKASSWWQSECHYGHFYRAIPLPPGINAEEASAAMHDGVLEITVPLQEPSAHRLEVQQAAH